MQSMSLPAAGHLVCDWWVVISAKHQAYGSVLAFNLTALTTTASDILTLLAEYQVPAVALQSSSNITGSSSSPSYSPQPYDASAGYSTPGLNLFRDADSHACTTPVSGTSCRSCSAGFRRPIQRLHCGCKLVHVASTVHTTRHRHVVSWVTQQHSMFLLFCILI